MGGRATTPGGRARATALGQQASIDAAFAVDERRVRRAFDRAAPTYDDAAGVIREIGRRLAEHLDPIRIDPRRILDVGAGTGADTRSLARRYPRARVYGLDSSRVMLSSARGSRRARLFSRTHYACADARALPVASGSIDLAYSNATLEWCADPDAVFGELARVLRPQGLIVLSTLGPDTLRELREIWAEVDGWVHVHRFIDMHDLGDALVRAGFNGVVMETERITVRYSGVDDLFTELRRCGTVNAARGRNPGLTVQARLDAVRQSYERLRESGQIPASCEVIYAHAWRASAGRVEISPGALAARAVRRPS